jgi:hemoglobin
MKEFFRSLKEEPFVPDQGPAGERPNPEIYKAMGDEGIINMIGEFYQRLHKSSIAPMFQRDLPDSVDRSASFFVQLLGGPLYFNSKFGPPRMRMRHLPFKINETYRKVWLDCFYETLDNPINFKFPLEEIEKFKKFLDDFSKWMINTRD